MRIFSENMTNFKKWKMGWNCKILDFERGNLI